MTPKLLYLDSQDYSRLSSASAGSPAYRDLERLRTLLDCGAVILPCSLVHIEELLRDFEVAPDSVTRRAEMLEELSRGWCLPDFVRVIEVESENLVIPNAKRVMPVENWGWIPVDRLNLDNLRDELRERYDAEIRKLAPNRRMRRVASSQFNKLIAQFAAEAVAKAVLENFGSDEALEKALLGQVLGKVPMDRVERECLRTFGRPTNFLRAYFSKSPPPKALQRVRSSGLQIAEAVRTTVAKLEELNGFSYPAIIRGITDQRFDAPWLLKLVRKDSDDAQAVAMKGPQVATAHFALFAIERLFREYLDQHFQATNRRRPRDSDFADIFHASYIGYVDYWRGDRYSADLVKKALPHFASRAFPTLSEAIDALEQSRA